MIISESLNQAEDIRLEALDEEDDDFIEFVYVTVPFYDVVEAPYSFLIFLPVLIPCGPQL